MNKIADLLKQFAEATFVSTATRLHPVSRGESVRPPTYKKGSVIHDRKEADGSSVKAALLDSTASSANRIEEALYKAIVDDEIDIPHMSITVGGESMTEYQRPHRAVDAVFRSGTLDGETYGQSPIGKAVLARSPKALFPYSPISCLLGQFHSDRKGAPGLKLPKSLLSTVTAMNVDVAVEAASRIDPLPISAATKVTGVDRDGFLVAEMSASGKEKPSTYQLGNHVPEVDSRGVTMEYALHNITVNCLSIELMHLEPEANVMLIAMGVAGSVLAFNRGSFLRVGCTLVPESQYEWEIRFEDKPSVMFTLSSSEARELLKAAVDSAKKAGVQLKGVSNFVADGELEAIVADGKKKYSGSQD